MEPQYPTPQEAPPYTAPSEPFFNRFLEAGKEGKNEWWRYVIGIILTFLVGYQLFGLIPLLVLVARGLSNNYFTIADLNSNSSNLLNGEFLHVDKNVMLACVLFIFVGAMLFLWIAVKFMHRKRMMALVASDRQPFSFKRYFLGFGLWMGINIIQLCIALISSPEYFTYVFQPGPFFGSLIVCLIMFPIQTGWEEIFVRGYLMQGLGLKTKTAFLPWILTSVLFGVLHIMNNEVQSNGVALMLPQYILPGLVFGAIVLMDERMELAMGMHFANNLFGALTISSTDMTIQANTIWTVKSIVSGSDIAIGSITQILMVFICYRIFRWNFEKLYR